MDLEIKAPENIILQPRITVFGVGGAGGNAVKNMIETGLQGANFVVANTDAQALEHLKCQNIIQLGAKSTKGLGAGASPEVGEKAAIESEQEIRRYLEGSNMVFITAGMGGGTGTGASPVVARIARELGILTIGVITKPFSFEGARRMQAAEKGIEKLQEHVDTSIVIPNQNLFRVANENTTFQQAFKMADEVLKNGVKSVTDLVTLEGLVNLDFADVKEVMRGKGKAMMGTGEAHGEDRAIRAAEAAISNPLLDQNSMQGALGVLINITGGKDMTLYEVDSAANRIREEVDNDGDVNIIFGSIFDSNLEGSIRVSVVATGIDQMYEQKQETAKSEDASIDEIDAPPSFEDYDASQEMNASINNLVEQLDISRDSISTIEKQNQAQAQASEPEHRPNRSLFKRMWNSIFSNSGADNSNHVKINKLNLEQNSDSETSVKEVPEFLNKK